MAPSRRGPQLCAGLFQDRPGRLQKDHRQDRAGDEIRPARGGKPDGQTRRGNHQALGQIVARAKPDRADVGVALAVADQQECGQRVGEEAQDAKAGDDKPFGRRSGGGALDRVAEDEQREGCEAGTFDQGGAGPHSDRATDHGQADAVGGGVGQEVEGVGAQGR